MECLNPLYLPKIDAVVPCGRCAFCGATKRSDWALRLHYEQKLHVGSKFVTLTYANNELTWNKNTPQLNKRDLQLWFKRVRKAGYKIRYYAVGEYGARTYRPHYHALIFGEVSDTVLREAWSKGHVHIGQVTAASVMYCLGYIVNGKGWKMRHHREPPFTLMSRRPGLGANYLTREMIEWHKSERKNYAVIEGEKRHLPRYYKGKIFSKVDHVRIAVRDGKAQFKKMVEFIRHPARMRMADPLAYYEAQRKILAKRIRMKCKENLTI